MGREKRKASDPYHTATTNYPCYVPVLGDSSGAGCMGLALGGKSSINIGNNKTFFTFLAWLFSYICRLSRKHMDLLTKKIGIKLGLISGALYFAYYFGAYIVDPELFVGYLKSVLFVLTVVILVMGAIQYKKAENSDLEKYAGYADLKGTFGIMVMIILVTSLISTISSLLVFQVIDPELGEHISQVGIEKVVEVSERFNLPEEQLEKQLEMLEGQNLFSLKSHFTNFITWFLVYSVIGLIIALIVKKNRPAFEYQPEDTDNA